MSMVFTDFDDLLMFAYPRARNLLAKVFYLPWLVDFAGRNHGLMLELDRNGGITRSFHDPTGRVVPGHISGVHDDGGVPYLGSYQSPFLGKLELKD
ncbi:adipocyte plasma membrane-associated protein-like [Stylophora pistillata]|uniref:adipocyte plasma membrane-associated protein-like n=1 Tax=Stylophora pistillata TaxID=50429 RepID=UPI000C03B710|nr:adipocyte plasma membrane-associated protein-like [Stylophora pistillata]